MGARVEIVPSISPINPGWTTCRMRARSSSWRQAVTMAVRAVIGSAEYIANLLQQEAPCCKVGLTDAGSHTGRHPGHRPARARAACDLAAPGHPPGAA